MSEEREKRRTRSDISYLLCKIMPGTPLRTTTHKQDKINKGANIIMQKHCRWNGVSSMRKRMLWFVYVYSFVDLRM